MELDKTVDFSGYEERVDFLVHLKYVRRLVALSNGLTATTTLNPSLRPEEINHLRHKLHLLDLTNKLLAEEAELVDQDPEYAHACVSWLPAKVYYALYHLLSIIEYILTSDRSLLRINHNVCLASLARRIEESEILFSNPLLNTVCGKAILSFKSRSGEVLMEGISDETLLRLLMKKIATEKLGDLKIRQKIDRRTARGKKAYTKLEDSLRLSIVDFFYCMRIRTNYKDLAFIDGIDPERARVYFLNYNNAFKNFYGCLNEVKNGLVAQIK